MENTYKFGHPWYYKLGGEIQSLKQIKAEVQLKAYKSYLRDKIENIACRPLGKSFRQITRDCTDEVL